MLIVKLEQRKEFVNFICGWIQDTGWQGYFTSLKLALKINQLVYFLNLAMQANAQNRQGISPWQSAIYHTGISWLTWSLNSHETCVWNKVITLRKSNGSK